MKGRLTLVVPVVLLWTTGRHLGSDVADQSFALENCALWTAVHAVSRYSPAREGEHDGARPDSERQESGPPCISHLQHLINTPTPLHITLTMELDDMIIRPLLQCATIALYVSLAILGITLSFIAIYHAGRTLGRNIVYRISGAKTFDEGPNVTGTILAAFLCIITIVVEWTLECLRDHLNWTLARFAAFMARGVVEGLLVLVILAGIAMLFPERPSWATERKRREAVSE